MARAKSIMLFLMDGDANGRIAAELSNWTGKAYKIPRNFLQSCIQRKELDAPGIYILLSKGDDDLQPCAYIGESESVFNRLSQHSNQKDFWTEAITFISKDNKLNKAHIKYLENKLYSTAFSVARFNLNNTSTPTRSNISEPEVAEMDEFFDNICLLTNALGCKIFEPIAMLASKTPENIFEINSKGILARGIMTNEGFVVLKDSHFIKKIAPGTQKNESFRSKRHKLISNSELYEDGELLIAARDILFTSPSAAASQVLGRSANGLTEWRTSDGRTLKSIE